MFDSKMVHVYRWFLFVLVGVALSAYYTHQRIFIEQQRQRRSMYKEFTDERENYTATHIVMAHLTAYVKEMTYLSKVKKVMATSNSAQTVFNDHLYPGLNNDNLVIVVRVHKSYHHLHHLVSSLTKVHGHNKLFVIFVHDSNDGEISSLVKDISVFKYMQFYYPYAWTIFLNQFPGQDPNFCDDDYNCFENLGKRNASLILQKHIWWWTLNRVFCLDAMVNYSKYVLFVDENSYIAEDLVHLMRLMQYALGEHCPDCRIMNFVEHDSLGLHYDSHKAYVTIDSFGSHFTNGIAFNRSTWNTIKASKESYCYFNDYSWIESLKNLIKSTREKFSVLSCAGARVFDTSKCKATLQTLLCEFKGGYMDITTFLQVAKRGFYPRSLCVIHKNTAEIEVLERGGWKDIRDKDLCILLASKAKSALGFGH